jgi:bifunctional DNA-binding transcriptional regulator/antitoxin component of YhaV-PrlF toxin-antitoxin module
MVPAEFCEALGWHAGETLTVVLGDAEISITSFKETTRRLQAEVRRYVPEGVSLVDELIAERRAEAAKEESE